MVGKGEVNDDMLIEDWVVEDIKVGDHDYDVISVNSDDDFLTDKEADAVTMAVDDQQSSIVTPGKLKRHRETENVDPASKTTRSTSDAKKKKWQLSQPVEKMSAEEQIDLFMNSYEFASKTAKVQLQPLGRPESADFVTLQKFGKHTDASYTRFIRFLSPDWKSAFKVSKKQRKQARISASPKVLIICLSARRCVEVLKHLVEFKCSVGKLFAKHMSITEQHEMLTRESPPIAVGTPNRLAKLLSLGHLELDSTTHIIIDMKVDNKDYHILNLRDTQVDFMDMFCTYCQPLVAQKKLKVAMY